MNTATLSSTTIERHTERKFLAQISIYTLEVTAQENGQHFGSIAIGHSYLDTHTGNWASQADAVQYLLGAIKREQASDSAFEVFIHDYDVILPEGFHTAEEIMAAAFTNDFVYEALTKINGIITSESNWKNPVRIVNDGFPVSWIEAATGFFSGCTMNAGLWRTGENWNYLYCEGYYARIGA